MQGLHILGQEQTSHSTSKQGGIQTPMGSSLGTKHPRKKIVIAMDYNTMILKNPHNTQFYFLSEVRRIKGKLNRNGSYHM